MVRLGDGNTAWNSSTLVNLFVEEWTMPTTPGQAASLLQVLTWPGSCTALPLSNLQGFLSAAADGSHLITA